MKTIKFRGLAIKGKRWVYGYYCKVEGTHYIIPESAEDYNSYIIGLIEVDPESVGQFTGIRDKKRTKEYPEGQEIYGAIPIDGKMSKGEDIVSVYYSCIDNKGWHEGSVKYDLSKGGCFTYAGFFIFNLQLLSEQQGFELEVIGNAIENPELLERAEK